MPCSSLGSDRNGRRDKYRTQIAVLAADGTINTADHHAVTYPDLERISHGCYQVVGEANEVPIAVSLTASPQAAATFIQSTMPNLVSKAARIAAVAHENQLDKAGEAYILHPLRLMARAQTDEERIVALLHDVVEDSGWTLEALEAERFPEHIVATIGCLTSRNGEDYDRFITRVLTNPLAIRIKLLDVEENMDMTRMSTLTDKDLERLHKYHAARRRLREA